MQTIKLNDTSEIRVEKAPFKNKTYLKIRIWHNGTPSWKGDGTTYTGPDKQGINLLFSEEIVNKLIEAINLEAFGGFETAGKNESNEQNESIEETL